MSSLPYPSLDVDEPEEGGKDTKTFLRDVGVCLLCGSVGNTRLPPDRFGELLRVRDALRAVGLRRELGSLAFLLYAVES